jgi:hypothetical protein
MPVNTVTRRSVQVLGSLAIVLVLSGMGYAFVIGWLNYTRIGV